MTITPFLFAAPNPVAVESRSAEQSVRDLSGDQSPSNQSTRNQLSGRGAGSGLTADGATLPYQPPIEDEFSQAPSAGETQYQVQLLQQEVQELRGLVEELTYKLEQMQRTQNDRYLELDGRFQRLQTDTPVEQNSSTPVTGQIGETTGEDEKTLYDNAVELIRARQYDLAISQLEGVISRYPDGVFTANAYYWLGEVHAAKPEPDYEAARQALAQVITYFPDNRKVPDAAFKLGKVYHLTGDCQRATELLNQVVDQHQGTTVAKLASDYLRDRMASCN